MTPRPAVRDSPIDDDLIEQLAALDEAPGDDSASGSSDKLAELAECLRFIDRVRRDTPELLADLTEGVHEPTPWLDASGDHPAQIGRFQIKRKIGQGGFGLVFLAHDPQLDRDVALKVPRVEALVTEQTRQRFLREGKAAASLNHPNIATVFEAGQMGPICYIATEYCAGGTLAELLEIVQSKSTPKSNHAPLLDARAVAS